MAYRVEVQKRASKELSRIGAGDQLRIVRAMEELGVDPRPPGCKKLKDSPYWRIRVGDYRVIYRIEEDRLLVLVVRIGHRKDVYWAG